MWAREVQRHSLASVSCACACPASTGAMKTFLNLHFLFLFHWGWESCVSVTLLSPSPFPFPAASPWDTQPSGSLLQQELNSSDYPLEFAPGLVNSLPFLYMFFTSRLHPSSHGCLSALCPFVFLVCSHSPFPPQLLNILVWFLLFLFQFFLMFLCFLLAEGAPSRSDPADWA